MSNIPNNNKYNIMPKGTTSNIVYYYNPDVGSYSLVNDQYLDFEDNDDFQVGSRDFTVGCTFRSNDVTFGADTSLAALLIKSSEGYMLYKKQSKYILEYKYPNIVKFVSDGNFITTYDEDLEQAIIQSTNNKEKNNIVDIMTNEKLIKKNFTLNTNTFDDEKHIKFKPIDNEIRNNVFLLVIKKNKIERITFMNDFDQSVTMIFKDFEKNIEVLDSSFKIDIPDSFDVIIDK